jgi:hypothetical protein
MANRVFLGSLLVLLLILGLLGGLWFLKNFEQHSEAVRSGYSDAARRNPWLAAERFLQRLGLQVESLSGREYLLSPPPESGVLLVRDLGPSLPPARQQALLEWVAAGSHLIVSLTRLPATDEPNNALLAHLGVSLHELELSEQVDPAEPVRVQLPGAEESIQVAFDPTRSLHLEDATADWQVPANSGYHLLHFRHGVGAITLLSDNRFFSNSEIDGLDHAFLLANLVQDAPRGWLLYSSQMPSLPSLIWQYAPYACISFCLLILAWLWYLTERTGPMLLPLHVQRRDLLEHLQAGAEFLWQHNRASGLQNRTRQQVEKHWLRRHPRLARLDLDARCAWLAEHTGLWPETIRQAMYQDQQEVRGLIHMAATLQRLNAALHPDKMMEQVDDR